MRRLLVRYGLAMTSVVLVAFLAGLMLAYDWFLGSLCLGLLTLRLIRAAGIATLLALGTFIAVMRRRDKAIGMAR